MSFEDDLDSSRCQNSVKHFRVEVRRNKIEFGQETFRDVQSFISHFDNCPLIGDDAGKVVDVSICY